MNEGGRLSANRLRAGSTNEWSRARGLGLGSRLRESELAMGLGGWGGGAAQAVDDCQCPGAGRWGRGSMA